MILKGNAAKRLPASVASHYPRRRFVVIEMDFIIVAKSEGNAPLFETAYRRLAQGLCTEWEEFAAAKDICWGYRFTHNVALNHAHPDRHINFLEYWEIDAKGKERLWR